MKPAKELKIREVEENGDGGGGAAQTDRGRDRDIRRFSLVSRAPQIIQVTAAEAPRRTERPQSSSALLNMNVLLDRCRSEEMRSRLMGRLTGGHGTWTLCSHKKHGKNKLTFFLTCCKDDAGAGVAV